MKFRRGASVHSDMNANGSPARDVWKKKLTDKKAAAAAYPAQNAERRDIELRLISAQDLKRVNRLVKMRTYAVAYVDEKGPKPRTHVDEKGGRNPVWNDLLTVSVADRDLQRDSLACLTIDIFCRGGSLITGADKLVGTVRIFLADAIRNAGCNPIRCLAFWVRLPSGEPHGILNIWIPPAGKFLGRGGLENSNGNFSRMLSKLIYVSRNDGDGEDVEARRPDSVKLPRRLTYDVSDLSPERALSLPSNAETERFLFD